ncbi:MAG: D-glycerate dehydrogenase [Phycisphaerae bacterium]|nr:D-glycerate dehydrogenase [Phycisphaerae bacterium]
MGTPNTPAPVVAFCRSVPPPVEIPGAQVRMGRARALPRGELLEFVAGSSAVVTWVSERVDAAFLDAAGAGLKAVCQFAVGVDNIDLDECRRRGVMVTNTPGAVTEGTADLAWCLILAVARRLNLADRFARSGEYPKVGPLGPDEFLGQDLAGRNLLIVGAGRIGYAVALRSLGWGMRVSYVARSRHLEFEMAPLAAHRVELDEGLRQADVVSIHTPLTDATRRLFNAPRLALLKPSAILVNTARGPIVDEAALVETLTAGRIWGAGLDVFEREPEVHPGLIGLDNCVLTPHVGSASTWSRSMMTRMVCENARAVLAGAQPPNRVC